MKVIKDLRPVEAFYILDSAGKEAWSEENALASTIAYLVLEDYAERPKKQSYDIPLIKTDKSRHNLRFYEKWCLDAIHNDDAEDLIDSVGWGYIRNSLTNQGFLRKELKEKKFLFVKWHTPKYYWTDKYSKAVKELDDLRNEITHSIENKKSDKYLLEMSYAFPSSGLRDGFLEIAHDVADVVEELEAAQMAIMAASTAVLIAATSSINISST
ncbi:hypothetical protein KY348_05105 [Candidatus Woesearchaeota archaeon]|nr:hypothetical protein [Candidatus Woesearchaeota archaeon]